MKKLMLIALLLLISLQTAQASPRDNLDFESFRKLPVQHEGRIKPLESFAANYLRKLSQGRITRNATGWLAEVIFDPQSASKRSVIFVGDKTVIEKLSLLNKKDKLYSLEELSSGLQYTEKDLPFLLVQEQEGKTLTTAQNELLRVHRDAMILSQLLGALSPVLPLKVIVPKSYSDSKSAFAEGPTYLELRKIENSLINDVRAIMENKGENLEQYTEEEKQQAALAFELQLLHEAALVNTLFSIIPGQWNEDKKWYTPALVFQSGQASPNTSQYLSIWQDLAKAWRLADQNEWSSLSDKALAHIQTIAPKEDLDSLSWEILYNQISPFESAIYLYLLSLIFLFFFLIKGKKRIHSAGIIAAAMAISIHLCGVILRVLILERPPVGSLYETLLFVSLIISLIALLIELKRKDALYAISGCCSASIILMIAPLIAPQGDDLEMLVAVLNSNFWLATHVLCITTGYALCILTAVLAHIYLWKASTEQNALSKSIYILSLAGLFFTAFGTVLGGIWADQSWGRFWGWDPKENGALLIVLWFIWLHHGRLGGMLKAHAFHAGLAFLNIIVAIAWFGVNLLNVGLHSYGFISGIASGLTIFCTAEALIIGYLWHRSKQINKGHTYAP